MDSRSRLDHLADIPFDHDSDDEMLFASGIAALTSPSLRPANLGASNVVASKRERQGPRGGKKPLRPKQQALCSMKAELERTMTQLKHEEDLKEKLQQRIKVLEVVLPVRERYALLLKQRNQQRFEQQTGDKQQVRPPEHGAQPLPQGHPLPLHSHYYHQAPPVKLRITELRDNSTSSSSATSGLSESPEGFLPDVGCFRVTSMPAIEDAARAKPQVDPGALWDRSRRAPYPAATGGSRLAAGVTPLAKAVDEAGLEPRTATTMLPFSSVRPTCRVPQHVVRGFISMWDTWVRDVGLVLHAHDARPHDPGPQLRLAQLKDRLLVSFTELRLEYPLLFAELMYINLMTGEREDPPPESFWLSVAQALRFTPEQVTGCRGALALYREQLGRVLAERKDLVQSVAAVMAALQAPGPLADGSRGLGAAPGAVSGVQGGGAGGGAAFMASRGQLVLQLEELTGRLHQNVVAEGQALEVVKDFLGNGTLSMVQTARASVLSYPYFPDAVAILNALVVTAGCPPDARAG